MYRMSLDSAAFVDCPTYRQAWELGLKLGVDGFCITRVKARPAGIAGHGPCTIGERQDLVLARWVYRTVSRVGYPAASAAPVDAQWSVFPGANLTPRDLASRVLMTRA